MDGGVSAGAQHAAGPARAEDRRCLCGSLLARLVAGGVELRCRRCKRTLLVPLSPRWSGETAHRTERIPVGEVG